MGWAASFEKTLALEHVVNVLGGEGGLENLHPTRALGTYGDLYGEHPCEKASPRDASANRWRVIDFR